MTTQELPFEADQRTKLPYDFSPERAETVKRKAVKRSFAHSDEGWRKEMLEVLRQVCLTTKYFTADLPMEVYAQDTTRPRTHNEKAMGGLMRRAASLGYCVPTDRYQNSNRASCHGRPIRIWASLIYQGKS